MDMNKYSTAKKVKIILYTFSGLVFLFLIGLFIKLRMDNAYLLKNGLRVKGAVVSKYEKSKSSRRGTKHNYEMELSLFVDSTSNKPAKSKTESFEDKMDALLADSKMRMKNRFREGYAKVIIEVSGDSYEKYSLGETVNVVHLKDNPDSARLLEDLE
jgi:hypothetical protein